MENVSVEQAVELILSNTETVEETEQVELLHVSGRILSQDMPAEFDNPPFHRAPVDGYACHSTDLAGASPKTPVKLRVTREIDAGQYSEKEIQKGEAVRIMTGAAIPPGCDCCIRQEDTDYGEEMVSVYHSPERWENFCFQGEDFKKGTALLKKGTRLGFVEAGILASMGVARVSVYRRPRVALLTTGDEVTDPGKPLLAGKIYNSNQTLLAVRLLELGVLPVCVKSVADDPAVMAEEIRKTAPSADCIITTGAVSVGKKDIMHEALRIAGAQRIFWRVKVKPGMPTLFSAYQGVPILSLSGNPFGVVVTVELFIRPMLQKISKDDTLKLIRVKGVMADSFDKPSRGRRFIRAVWKDHRFYLPDGLHSNGALASMAGCNCLIDLKPGTPAVVSGMEMEAILL